MARRKRHLRQYQKLLEKQPKLANFEEIRRRQFEIANLYLGGKWFKLWGYIPFRSMERTAQMYRDIVKTGPYSDIAPQAQLNIGTAQERAKGPRLQVPRLFRRRQGLRSRRRPLS